ncbi:MAG: hypothetical protein ACI9KE_005806 [Polyangiales bacterium]|jgi:hypothetical protein
MTLWVRRLSVLLLAAAACTGEIGTVDELPPVIGPTRPDPGNDCEVEVPATPLRRLTSEELRNTLEELVGDVVYADVEATVLRFPGESIGGGDLEGWQAGHVEPHVAAMLDIGDALANALRARPEALSTLGHECMASAPDAACVEAFVAQFGERVHRRPLSPEELTRYVEGYNSEGDSVDSFSLLMMTLVSSPAFLFHMEVEGEEVDGVLTLDDYAIASRLSYRVLRTMPTQALFDSARAGELRTPEQIGAAAEVLMEDPRARHSVWRFFEQWLEMDDPLSVDNDPALLDGLEREGLDEALVAELRAFVDSLVWDDDAGLDELLTSRRVPTQDPRVASIYGVTPWDGEGAYPESGPERVGLLLRAALLQSSTLPTAPITRGVFVLRRYLCDQLPPPDLDVVNSRLSELENLDRSTMRASEIISTMTGELPCSNCHQAINPIAFALEDFDGLGRHRTEELAIVAGEVVASFPIEPAGASVELDVDVETLVDGGADLARALSESRRVQDCFAERLMVHTQGREATLADSCAIRRQAIAADEGASLRDLYLQSVVASSIDARALESE